MNVIDLFSGIGGFSLGLGYAGMRTVQFCEIDPYCRRVLAKHWPDVPCHDDIRKFDPPPGAAELICGGYPCQGESEAGERRGTKDERWLWPEMLRIIRGVGPRWVVAENVSGHISLNFDSVAASLEDEGFTVWPFIIPASAVGAPHRRDRVWIVANSQRSQRRSSGTVGYVANGKISQWGQTSSWSGTQSPDGGNGIMADADGKRESQQVGNEREVRGRPVDGGKEKPVAHTKSLSVGAGLCPSEQRERWGRRFSDGRSPHAEWSAEPSVGRVADGIPHRLDRLRGLGNAIVPQIAALIGEAIMQFESQSNDKY